MDENAYVSECPQVSGFPQAGAPPGGLHRGFRAHTDPIPYCPSVAQGAVSLKAKMFEGSKSIAA